MREREIEKAFSIKAKKAGGLAIKFISPAFDGMPDRLVLMPAGKMAFVEFKAPGKKPRALQLVRHRTLSSLGFRVFVLDDVEKIDEVLYAIQTT